MSQQVRMGQVSPCVGLLMSRLEELEATIRGIDDAEILDLPDSVMVVPGVNPPPPPMCGPCVPPPDLGALLDLVYRLLRALEKRGGS